MKPSTYIAEIVDGIVTRARLSGKNVSFDGQMFLMITEVMKFLDSQFPDFEPKFETTPVIEDSSEAQTPIA